MSSKVNVLENASVESAETKANVGTVNESAINAESKGKEGVNVGEPTLIERIGKSIPTGLLVSRSLYKSQGKDFWEYFVEGKILGRVKRAVLLPTDKNSFSGYDWLDTIFEDKTSIDLFLVPYERRDNNSNKIVQKGVKYMAYTIGSDGIGYDCMLKQKGASDGSILNAFLKYQGIEVETI